MLIFLFIIERLLFKKWQTWYQCWAPQIYALFRNRKIAMGGPQPQIRKFAERLR